MKPPKGTILIEDLPAVFAPRKKDQVFRFAEPHSDSPTATLLTLDGGTLYVAGGGQQYLWAYRVDNDYKATARSRYAPLRLKTGNYKIGVTALATDKDGRIYAATDIGVQVFDPIGRLCGVLTPAAPGEPEFMVFEGDKLTLWIGDTKYARKLNTQGVK